jgi:hypothetical protein
MSYEDLKLYALVGSLFWNMGLTVALWLRKPGEDAGRAVDTLRQHVDGGLGALRAQHQVMEERIRHMPTSEELAELEGTVRGISVQTAGLAESMQTVRGQLNRIENYLLQAK